VISARTFEEGYIEGWRAVLGAYATVPRVPEYRGNRDGTAYDKGRDCGVMDALIERNRQENSN
jgi:hypothetical protein